jgi:hypothetical protein
MAQLITHRNVGLLPLTRQSFDIRRIEGKRL